MAERPGPGTYRRRPAGSGAGFSLTELVMALVILLIIIPQVVPVYDAFINDMEKEALKERLGYVRRAIVAFKMENGRYPYQVFDHFGNNVDFLDEDYSELTQGVHNGFGVYPTQRRIYLDRMPEDPVTGRTDWLLVGVDNDGDGAFNEDPIEVTTSTHRVSAVARGLTSGTISPINYVPFDNDRDGLVDEDPVDVYDIRTRARGQAHM